MDTSASGGASPAERNQRQVAQVVQRIGRLAALFYLVAALLMLGTLDVRLFVGVSVGWLLALGVLWSWYFLVARGLRCDPERRAVAARKVALLGVIKLPLVGLIIFGLIASGLVHAGWFALGFTLPQVAMGVVFMSRRIEKTETRRRHVVASR